MFTKKNESKKEKMISKDQIKDDLPINSDKKKVSWLSFGKRKIDSAFGMSISDTSIELLELRPFFTHKPSSYSRIKLESGIVKRGKIVDLEILSDKIKTLLLNAKPGKVSTNKVVLSLPEEQVFTWSVAMDKSISGSELKNKIFEEAKKVVPLDFKKIYWDFVSHPLKQKELQYVTFVGVDQDILNGYVDVCNKVGLEIVDFSLEAINLARVFLPQSDKDDYVLFDMGGETSTISIVGGNRLLKFSFTTSLAGDYITKSIASVMNINELEAEELKVKFGISDGPSPVYRQAIETAVSEIANQINEAISYYEKNSGETVDAIYMTGGSSLLKGISEFVSEETGKVIEPLLALPFIAKSSIFSKEINLQLFADAVGLALLGISQDYKTLSFRKQMLISSKKPGCIKKIKSGYFSIYKMIFSPAHVTYGLLILTILSLSTIFILMYLDLKK